MEDQIIDDFGKEEAPQEQSEKSFEEGTKPCTLVQGEEEAHDDTLIPPPSDDEGEDEVVDDNTNDFVDDVEQE